MKRSALSSSSGTIRGQASEFEHQHQRHLKTIGDQLRSERFSFDDFEGVLKDKNSRKAKGKEPRPIAIGSMRNRVVQRAILQVLQPRRTLNPSVPNSKFEARHDDRIGALNDVNRSRFGVGGLMAPYGGVQPAIRLVMRAMDEGATEYFQSDIKAFFTRIPTKGIVDRVLQETKDEKLAKLFSAGLEVNLANKDELQSYAKLFPSGGVGVAQGSSLSAFAGNVLLFDFDHRLNEMGVVAVRYIDDIFMLSGSTARLGEAISYSREYLGQFGFSLYEPGPGSNKASAGLCRDSFNFLGCTIQPNRCVPSSASTSKIVADVRENLSKSKRAIRNLISRQQELDPQLSKSATIDRIGRKLFGWEKSYSFATDSQAFRYVDEKVGGYVDSYDRDVGRMIKSEPLAIRMRALGIPSTQQLYERDRKNS